MTASESTGERALRALLAALKLTAPRGARVLRNAVLPERIPAAGLLILRDGEPGAPQTTLSPLRYHFEHAAQVDLAVEETEDAARDARFDALRRSIAAACIADRTLGGVVDWCEPEASGPAEIAVEGAETLKAATITVQLHYATSDPLL